MIRDDAKALLEAGSALIVGLTFPDGKPFATRGYGLDVHRSGQAADLIVRAADLEAFGLRSGDAPATPIAVTAADVGTLSSVQVKGTLVEIVDADEADRERKDRYCDLFIAAIEEVDGIAPHLAASWRPADALLRCHITLGELFVQTPGPGAGASLGKVAE